MSLSTNSWDVVYTSRLDSVNNALGNIVGQSKKINLDAANWTFTQFEVSINIAETSDSELKFTLKLASSNKTVPASFGTNIFHFKLLDFNSEDYTSFKTQLASSNEEIELMEYISNNKLLHVYFSNLSIFKGHDWINPGIVRIQMQGNKYKLESVPDKNNPGQFTKMPPLYISFCYMLSRMENGTEKAINYNDAYVDFNAIPEGATSALIIERSAFGMYMVAPKIGKDILQKFDKSDGDVSFDKLGAYTMINKEKSKFRYADFITSLTYIGIVPIVDWLSSLFGGVGYPIYRGTVPAESASITVNEDHINFRVKDAEYMYSLENWPKITQEYIITLNYQQANPEAKKVAGLIANVRLIDAGINYFHTDFIPEAWHLFGISHWLRDKDSKESSRRALVFDYLLSTAVIFNEWAREVRKALQQQKQALEKKKEDIQKDPNLSNEKKEKLNVIVENRLEKNRDAEDSMAKFIESPRYDASAKKQGTIMYNCVDDASNIAVRRGEQNGINILVKKKKRNLIQARNNSKLENGTNAKIMQLQVYSANVVKEKI